MRMQNEGVTKCHNDAQNAKNCVLTGRLVD